MAHDKCWLQLGGGFTGGLLGLCCHFLLENYVNCNSALFDIIERSINDLIDYKLSTNEWCTETSNGS